MRYNNPHEYYVTQLYFFQHKPQYLREVCLLECDTEVFTKVLRTTQPSWKTVPYRLVDNYRLLERVKQYNKSIVHKTLLDLLDPEHGGTTLCRNVGNTQGNLKNIQDY